MNQMDAQMGMQDEMAYEAGMVVAAAGGEGGGGGDHHRVVAAEAGADGREIAALKGEWACTVGHREVAEEIDEIVGESQTAVVEACHLAAVAAGQKPMLLRNPGLADPSCLYGLI